MRKLEGKKKKGDEEIIKRVFERKKKEDEDRLRRKEDSKIKYDMERREQRLQKKYDEAKEKAVKGKSPVVGSKVAISPFSSSASSGVPCGQSTINRVLGLKKPGCCVFAARMPTFEDDEDDLVVTLAIESKSWEVLGNVNLDQILVKEMMDLVVLSELLLDVFSPETLVTRVKSELDMKDATLRGRCFRSPETATAGDKSLDHIPNPFREETLKMDVEQGLPIFWIREGISFDVSICMIMCSLTSVIVTF
ncbi:hypothetical protein L6452_32356 [Arctium lappa]|uniref:Uncharacterized protein n=1 Tax=Arctium lappa TaxID=4217 RepID=A0ACB8Z4E6_ARCLA|nr:hypothetical protein L6452_32356 [Arctium lappa]